MTGERARVLAEACAVGLEARGRMPSAARVAQLRARAVCLDAREAGLIAAFGAAFDAARYDRAAVAEAGRALLQGAIVALQPVPAGFGRADIHG